MASTIQIDPTDPGMAEVIANAKVGQELVIREVRLIPSQISQTGFTGEIVGVALDSAPEEAEASAQEETAPVSTETPEGYEQMPKTNPGYDTGMA